MNMTRINRILLYTLLVVMFILTLMPILVMILTSVKTMNELIIHGPIAWPLEWRLQNIVDAWERGNFGVYYKNTMIITTATVILITCFSLVTAYVLIYFIFPGKKLLMGLLLFGLIVPLEAIVIPMFYLLKDLKLLNTYWAIILPNTALFIPFGTFLLSGFIRTLPYGVIESARIDGAGDIKILRSIITPMVQPAVVTLILFSSLSVWNSFLLPTVLIQKDDLRMVSVGLNYFQSLLYMEYPMIMSGALIIAAPIILIYVILHRRMIESLTAGSMKG